MVLVDTSVWVNHFRSGDDELRRLLDDGLVLVHPSVIGELSCAEMRNREEILNLLAGLPECSIANYDECRYVTENSRIRSTGIGWGDTQIIASARISHADLYTRNRRMMRGWQVLS